MKEKTIVVNDLSIIVKSWAFLKMLNRKKQLLEIIGEHSDSIMKLIDSDESVDDIPMIIGMIKDVLTSLTDNKLTWFISIIFESVTINGESLSDEEVQDKHLSGQSTLFYDICRYVLEVNYGDFFQTILGKLKQQTPLES